MDKSRLFCFLLPFILTSLWVCKYDSWYGSLTPTELNAESTNNITYRPLINNYTMICFKKGTITYGGVNVGPVLYLENKINVTENDTASKPRGMVFRSENTTHNKSFW